MISFLRNDGCGPIGLELGNHAVQMMQFTADHGRLVDAVRWDLPRGEEDDTTDGYLRSLAEAIQQARQGRAFQGREVVVGLNPRHLFVQNIRVPKVPAAELDLVVGQEAASRLPFPAAEADVRYVCAGEVRQGDQTRREIVLLACHRPLVDRLLDIIDEVDLRAVCIDVEPSALLRSQTKQFRRDDDHTKRVMFVRLGASCTTVVIAQGTSAFFIKYIDVGGDQLDDAVARHLNIPLEEAAMLRWNNGERRADKQDPDVAASVNEATRGVIERLASELSLCMRYHSVAFRGHSIDRLVLGGSDASQGLLDALAPRVDMTCHLGDPLRSFEGSLPPQHAQWDVAAGLALRTLDT